MKRLSCHGRCPDGFWTIRYCNVATPLRRLETCRQEGMCFPWKPAFVFVDLPSSNQDPWCLFCAHSLLTCSGQSRKVRNGKQKSKTLHGILEFLHCSLFTFAATFHRQNRGPVGEPHLSDSSRGVRGLPQYPREWHGSAPSVHRRLLVAGDQIADWTPGSSGFGVLKAALLTPAAGWGRLTNEVTDRHQCTVILYSWRIGEPEDTKWQADRQTVRGAVSQAAWDVPSSI